MIKDALKQILDIEQEMRAILNEANELAEQIRGRGEAEANALPAQARAEAEEEARRQIAKAKEQAELSRREIIEKAEAEAARLRERAEANMPNAVFYVLSQITGADLQTAKVSQTSEV